MEKLRIVVGGFIGLYPTGGVTWDYLQYPLGFQLLGHDVFYIEDTGQYPTYRKTDRPLDDPFDTVTYLQKTMQEFGLSQRWAYRDTFNGKCYGMSLAQVMEICATADIFINVSDATIYREEYLKIPTRILLDSDPMFTQVQTTEVESIDLRYHTAKIPMSCYTHYFSFGENIGAENCRIPTLDINWLPTRQPICFDYWNKQAMSAQTCKLSFSTVMNWSTRTKLFFEKEEWGQKDVEFKKFIDLPKMFDDINFKIILAVSAGFKKNVNPSHIENYGWKVLDPMDVIATTHDYKRFIQSSSAEFSAAKETYVKSNSGWFSGRSACYLAAGKPVVAQDTQWSKYIPSGEGLLACSDLTTASAAITDVIQDYPRHAKAAKSIGYEYFDSGKVLSHLLALVD
ncbi:hypothetical protein GCM10022408_28840 [Hymenobacter fastidiosus]|uniref:Glycosyltransferase family 1 protein n=1 Tax=Hymenobacter fastidiosus TaxID=486264 RepID=A0ABP7SN58_9BACT